MTIFKSIAYAYASSPSAIKLGHKDSGCYYVVQRDGNNPPYAAHNGEGYLKHTDTDLIAFYHECDGIIDPMFKKYGNSQTLKAIGA